MDFKNERVFFSSKNDQKSVYKGIPYQIEISNTQNRLLTQNPPQKSTIDLKSQDSALKSRLREL